MQAILIPHPTTTLPAERTVEVELSAEGAVLWLRFVIEGDIDTIDWPEPVAPGRADELWKQTVFEAFVATSEGYREYNLSSSGQWATYAFDGYRNGMREAEEVATVLGLDGGRNLVALEARIELPLDARALALSVVIRELDGRMSYWALAHPSDKPDFHHPDSFVLELP